MKKILHTLFQPYPYKHSQEKLLKQTAFILLFIFLFLFLFRPFNVNESELKYNYPIICLIHALNGAVIYLLFFTLYNTLARPEDNEENWTGIKATLLIAIFFLLIGFGSFLLRPALYTTENNFSWHYFFQETLNTFLASTLVSAFFTLLNYRKLLKENQDSLADLEKNMERNQIFEVNNVSCKASKTVSVIIENEVLELNPDEFIFAKSDGNYVTFYFKKEASIIKLLKRMSLKSVEEQIDENASLFIRTHRAYLVNIKHITKMTGNAQGYQLYFELIDFPVPVSRALLPRFKQVMEGK